MADLFKIQSDALPRGTRVVGFRGTEGLSRPYVFEIFLQVSGAEAHDTDIGDAVGTKACLVASRADDRDPFVFAGRLEELCLLHEVEERIVLRAVLMPRLRHLSRSMHSRMFTRRSIPEIIETVLKDNGFSSTDYALRLEGQYKPEEHVCQYKESDLDFVSRWMEREGLYYFFEHAEGGETLVITDHRSFHGELVASAVRYSPQGAEDVTAGEHLESFVCRHRQLPASVRFKDHDYIRPTLDVSGSAVVSRSGLGEIHQHGARLFTPDAAKRLATLRAEELKSRERLFSGGGTALYLRSGYRFSLTDHPRAAFDRTYLAVEVEHHGNQMAGAKDLQRMTGLEDGGVYRVQVTAIPADVQFRAESKTPWPRIHGAEHGTVDGEADSDYAQLDEHGRYLVRFAFDESDLGAGKASTWVRMMQPHGGSTEGWHFPLRKGTEVLFTFLGGDPDRPVIAGVVPTALTPSNVTSRNHTQNVLKTGGGSYIIMDDLEDQQYIDGFVKVANTGFHMGKPASFTPMVPPANPSNHQDEEAELNVTYGIATDGDAAFKVGGSWWQGVGANYWLMVKGVGRIRIGGDYTFATTGNTMELYHGSRKSTVTTGYLQEIFGGYEQEIEPGGSQTVKGNWTHKVTGENHDDYGAWKTDVSKTWTADIGGNISITSADGTVTIKSSGTLTLDAPEVKQTAPAKWSKSTTHSLESYLTKNSYGIQKGDACAISVSVTGAKRDTTVSSNSVTGIKMDLTTMSVAVVGAKYANDGVKMGSIGIDSAIGGFESRVKAFLKIG